MSALPAGTVTFLFTDVEGSTRLLQELGDRYADVLAEHHRILRDAFARHNGVEIDAQGDGFFAVFTTAGDAVQAARDAQQALAGGPVRVRMGLHTGAPRLTKEGYVGIDVHRAARIAAAGHGGQILVSQATRDLVDADGLRDLGEHRLKDLAAPERIYQLGNGRFPPLRSLSNSNLPLPPEPLIGRKKERADVLRSLREGQRITTITGPGGVGKTRFALELAAELIPDFADGVWWIGFAPLRDARLVLPTIAAALGVKSELADELGDKQVLLLLDNFEHVLDAAPDMAELQTRCPNVVFLVTSREPLHVAAEREYPLSPLPEAPAVELLRRRAEAITPDFQAHYRDLVQVCDRVDRLPLAIELAAARTKALSVGALLERLDQRLPLLTSRRRDVDERQQTLRATIEWSYELLSPDEQELFARLAVFSASLDLDAAEVVCSADLDGLESLVDKSLLRRDGDDRLFVLSTLKEFAAEKLRILPDADDVRRRHDDHFLALAEDLNQQERFSGMRDLGAESLARFGRESPNFRAALAGLLDADRKEAVLRLGAALERFWLNRVQYRDAAEWLERAPLDDTAVSPEVRAPALAAAGSIAYYVYDDVDRADTFWREGLQLQREQDDAGQTAAALARLADVAWRRRDYDAAIAYYHQAVPLFEQVGDEAAYLNALHCLGDAYRDRGDLDDGERALEETAARARRQGLHQQLASTLHSLGDVALDRHDVAKAFRRFAEALDYAIATGSRRAQIYCVAGVASALLERGDDHDGLHLWAIANDLERQFGFRILRIERERYERLVAAAEKRLGRREEPAPGEAVGLTLEQAVAEARRHIPPP